MRCQRKGTNLKIDIRIALSVLGRDPHQYDGERLTIKELQEIKSNLHREYMEGKNE